MLVLKFVGPYSRIIQYPGVPFLHQLQNSKGLGKVSMASRVLRRMPLSFLLQLSLILTPGAGSPLPSSTDDEEYHSEKRSFTGDSPLEAWEVAIILLGALFGIMLLGLLGGICEVMLHGKIKESNAEADAKLEGKGDRDIADEAEGGKMESDGIEGSEGAKDQGRYSWEPERMTTGLSDDSTLAGSDRGASQSDLSSDEQAMSQDGDWYGEAQQAADGADQNHAQTSEQYTAWNGDGQPQPNPSQFDIDDVDSPGYGGGDDNAQHDAYQGHLNPPPAMPKDTALQHQDTGDQNWQQGADATSYTGSSQGKDNASNSGGYTGPSTMAVPGAYSGEGYSPAVMPDSADYLAEYRQSQLYLQHDDDWYTAASASYGAPAGTAQ